MTSEERIAVMREVADAISDEACNFACVYQVNGNSECACSQCRNHRRGLRAAVEVIEEMIQEEESK